MTDGGYTYLIYCRFMRLQMLSRKFGKIPRKCGLEPYQERLVVTCSAPSQIWDSLHLCIDPALIHLLENMLSILKSLIHYFICLNFLLVIDFTPHKSLFTTPLEQSQNLLLPPRSSNIQRRPPLVILHQRIQTTLHQDLKKLFVNSLFPFSISYYM